MFKNIKKQKSMITENVFCMASRKRNDFDPNFSRGQLGNHSFVLCIKLTISIEVLLIIELIINMN